MDSPSDSVMEIPVVLLSIIIGAGLLVVIYVLKFLQPHRRDQDITKNVQGAESLASPTTTTGSSTGGGKLSKKRGHAAGNGSGDFPGSARGGGWRSDKGGFSHPWLLTSLKGHSGIVTDMDLSSNGKFLATCAEDPPLDPDGAEDGGSSGSECHAPETETDSRPCSTSVKSGGTLSRRQRKNRLRADNSPVSTPRGKKTKPKRPKSGTGMDASSAKGRNQTLTPPLRQHTKLNLAECDLANFLRSYLLSEDQLLTLGYPVESSLYPSRAIIYKNIPQHPSYNKKSHFDVNAREFIPTYCCTPGMDYNEIKSQWIESHHESEGDNVVSGDSGQGSGSSSPQSVDSDERELADVAEEEHDIHTPFPAKVDSNYTTYTSDEKSCVRCGKGFFVTTDGEYLTQERCLYHWGKLQKVFGSKGKDRYDSYTARNEYTCCRGHPDSRGCMAGKLHVWNGVDSGVNGPFEGYVRTKRRRNSPVDGNYGVYALDCEMCYTVRGLELAKLTVVGADGRLVYDTFVKPECEIVDYNTRFSGITSKDLARKSVTKTLKEVQNDLMGFINADTILIGHGLENDLRALKIMHGTVVDTAITFPHYYGLPFRRSLKSLTNCFLKRDIQTESGGHNSFEDSRACVELMLWRVRKDFRSILEQ